MAKRRWTDAPPAERCAATVTLRDGTTAQCGRRKVEGAERVLAALAKESGRWRSRSVISGSTGA